MTNEIEITGVKKLIDILREGVKKYPDFRVILSKSKLWYGNQHLSASGCFSSLVDAGRGGTNGKDWYDTGTWIARTLGFNNQLALKFWAQTHPEKWGNDFGKMLFRRAKSYGVSDDFKMSAKEVLDHWEKVLERLEEN